MKLKLTQNQFFGGFEYLPEKMPPGTTFVDIYDPGIYAYNVSGKPVKLGSNFSDITGILGTPNGSKFLRDDGTWVSISGGGNALTTNPLSQFALTTKSQLNSIISNGLILFQDDLNTINWDSAFNWGNHSLAGYLTSVPSEFLTQTEGDERYLQSYTETNNLTSAVVWANVPNANITQGSVTQHQSALSITESQISDLGSYLESVNISDINTTGTASASTYLRGDGQWSTIASSSSVQVEEFIPTVDAASEEFTLSTSDTVIQVFNNGVLLKDSEWSQLGTTLTVTPVSGGLFSDGYVQSIQN